MVTNLKGHKSYFELAEHNTTQMFVFVILCAGLLVIVISTFLPVLQYFFVSFLNGKVHNETGVFVSFSPDSQEPKMGISYVFSWAVDIYKNKTVETRYWFNPTVTIFLQSFMLSLVMAIVTTSLLPEKLGYMRQKIEREIINTIDKIIQKGSSKVADYDLDTFFKEILLWDLRSIQEKSEETGISQEDLKVLNKAVKWKYGSFLYRLIHINDGIRIYMRFYFTVQYSNAILGFVYIGAAILIIIIGLRGLKFIPPTQPSAVLFALSLEFSLLITYAITLMYSKIEDEHATESGGGAKQSEQLYLNKDFGSNKDIENLLRVFIHKRK
jgi:hypothetical protein